MHRVCNGWLDVNDFDKRLGQKKVKKNDVIKIKYSAKAVAGIVAFSVTTVAQ